jgi:hypothetical protein
MLCLVSFFMCLQVFGIRILASLPIMTGGEKYTVPFLQTGDFCPLPRGGVWKNDTALWQENKLYDWLFRGFLLNHCFISTSLILHFSFWQVNQEAAAKLSIICGILGMLGVVAMREGSLATVVSFYSGCRILESCSCWLPCTPPFGFILRMSQWPACRWHLAIDAGTDFQTLCSLYWFFSIICWQ